MYSEGCMEKEREELASNLNVKVRAKYNRREVSLLPATIEEIGDLLDNKLSDTSPIFCKLRSTILEDIKTIISQEINLALNEFKNELTQATDFLAAEQADLKVKVEQKDKEIKDLQTQTLKLKKEVYNLHGRLSTIEKISRDNNLEINGIQEKASEDLFGLFHNLCNTINSPIADSDIRACHRVAKMDQSSSRPRSVLVTLTSPRIRDRILEAVNNFNKTQSGKLNSKHLNIDGATNKIYVSEYISPDCKALFREARRVGKEKNFKFIWVKRGNVYARKVEGATPMLIKNIDCLVNLV
ncbi:unnamed protein product [Parnassius apollo]|uniref:(apollo) hypothetical protein n=1 Tax=Parnassius apollo TaxID=110799 RepID=A0A8S3WUP4_PARAO|nr:unnamed protein product [Parnassius apollo]